VGPGSLHRPALAENNKIETDVQRPTAEPCPKSKAAGAPRSNSDMVGKLFNSDRNPSPPNGGRKSSPRRKAITDPSDVLAPGGKTNAFCDRALQPRTMRRDLLKLDMPSSG